MNKHRAIADDQERGRVTTTWHDMRGLERSSLAIAGGRPTRESFLLFGAPLIGEEEIDEVVDTLRSGWIGFGPKCLRLEEMFARYTGAREAVSLASCTAALHLALLAAGVGTGDEVITTPVTFPATVNVIEHTGARPIFADVERGTQNIDPGAVSAALTSRTKAIIPVHMAGRPCDIDSINELAVRNGVTVIEDAAHATEAQVGGRRVGTISRFTAFSFYATKNLTTADGGMLTTSDSEAANRIRILRQHGISRDAWHRYSLYRSSHYETVAAGYKCNLTDLQASLGLHQLARLETNLRIRERNWRSYDAGFADLGDVIEVPAPVAPSQRHARHLYTILLHPERLQLSRDRFMAALHAENIGSGIHFVPVHLQPYYRDKYGYRRGDYPNAEYIGKRSISLPMSAALEARDVADVITAVRKIVAYCRG